MITGCSLNLEYTQNFDETKRFEDALLTATYSAPTDTPAIPISTVQPIPTDTPTIIIT